MFWCLNRSNATYLKQAIKLRPWRLSIPLPRVSPIIISALLIPNDLNAPTLFALLEPILHAIW
jgi:hypothetical protein